jgi:hypothetical protein
MLVLRPCSALPPTRELTQLETEIKHLRRDYSSDRTLIKHVSITPIRRSLIAAGRLRAPSSSARVRSKNVKRTARWTAQFPDHVGIDHRRFDVGVPEIFLNLPDVDTIQQQMRGERVTK